MTVASNRRDNTFKNDNGMAAQRMCGVGVTAQRCKHAFVLSLCGRFLTARTNITRRNSGQSPTGAYARFEPGFAIIRPSSRHGPSGEYLKFWHIPRSALGGPPAAVRTPLSARSQQGKHTGRHNYHRCYAVDTVDSARRGCNACDAQKAAHCASCAG